MRVVKAGTESGRPLRHVLDKGGKLVAMIRYFDRCAQNNAGRYTSPVGWALLHVTGRTDWFDTYREALDDARKAYV